MATLLEKLKSQSVSKIHKLFVNEQQGQWVKCVKPNGETYGMITQSFVDRVDKGEIEIVNEDEKKGIVEFTYKGSSSPFK